MLVIRSEQIRIFEQESERAGIAALCAELRASRYGGVGWAEEALEGQVQDRVAEALACGFASKADVHCYVEFTLFDYPGFERAAEFRNFLARPAERGSYHMLEFIGHVSPAFWARYAESRAGEEDGLP
jgi:hypothetical protein